jgi:hypothetical protein
MLQSLVLICFDYKDAIAVEQQVIKTSKISKQIQANLKWYMNTSEALYDSSYPFDNLSVAKIEPNLIGMSHISTFSRL